MSGIDEQLYDIPKCPICGKIPSYWTLSDNEYNYVLWLYSKKHINTDLGEPYNEYMGEGKFKFLRNPNIIFINAICQGSKSIRGCHNEIEVEEYPEVFKIFRKMYERYFPDTIYNTD